MCFYEELNCFVARESLLKSIRFPSRPLQPLESGIPRQPSPSWLERTDLGNRRCWSPDAQILNFDSTPIEEIQYDDTLHYVLTRRFLENRAAVLREVFEDDEY